MFGENARIFRNAVVADGKIDVYVIKHSPKSNKVDEFTLPAPSCCQIVTNKLNKDEILAKPHE